MTASRKVHFNSRGIGVIGNSYLPLSTAPNRKRAAIIVGHPGTDIKEEASGLYARLLADNGFITLAFDAAYQGESRGEPRNLEDPYQRAEDFKSATSFLSTLHDDVDPERIGVVGICASGGYEIFASQTDIHMKAVAGVVAMCTGAMARARMQNESNNINPENLRQTLQFSAHARTSEARGEQPIMANALDALPEAAEYYNTPVGYHPLCTNEQLARSVELMLNYNSFAFIY